MEECTALIDRIDNTDFRTNVIGYIAGYVIQMVRRFIKCEECNFNLLSEAGGLHHNSNKFLFRKMRGGLVLPCRDVVEICVVADHYFNLHAEDYVLKKNWANFLTNKILRDINFNKLFPQLKQHQLEAGDHVFRSVKVTIICYLKIKICHRNRLLNEKLSLNIRNKLSRLIIFQHD